MTLDSAAELSRPCYLLAINAKVTHMDLDFHIMAKALEILVFDRTTGEIKHRYTHTFSGVDNLRRSLREFSDSFVRLFDDRKYINCSIQLSCDDMPVFQQAELF